MDEDEWLETICAGFMEADTMQSDQIGLREEGQPVESKVDGKTEHILNAQGGNGARLKRK
eukprot:6191202-Pleurochrysis_carterae.AAC.2